MFIIESREKRTWLLVNGRRVKEDRFVVVKHMYSILGKVPGPGTHTVLVWYILTPYYLF